MPVHCSFEQENYFLKSAASRLVRLSYLPLPLRNSLLPPDNPPGTGFEKLKKITPGGRPGAGALEAQTAEQPAKKAVGPARNSLADPLGVARHIQDPNFMPKNPIRDSLHIHL